jgi:hypothetical protein
MAVIKAKTSEENVKPSKGEKNSVKPRVKTNSLENKCKMESLKSHRNRGLYTLPLDISIHKQVC